MKIRIMVLMVLSMLLLSFQCTYAADYVISVKDKPGSVDTLLWEYSRTEDKLSFDCCFLPGFHSIKQDMALGYPESSYGMNFGLGFSWRKYIVQPTKGRSGERGQRNIETLSQYGHVLDATGC